MAWACSCVPRTPCGVHRYGDADFVGEVVSRGIMPSDDKLGVARVMFNVRVVESFRGPQKAGEIISVRTGFGGGDCGYAFKVGAKYLIDASKDKDAFGTSICSLTAPIEDAEVELRTLRSIAAGQRVPDLTGVLMRGTETDDSYSVTPLPGVPVEAKPIAGGSVRKTVTDAFGSFTFPSLSKGKYQLILGLPTNLSAAYSDSGILDEEQVPSISIESTDVNSAACHIRVFIEPSGSISGVVQPSGSTPIDGWVEADTVTPDDKPWNTVRTTTPGPDGKFSLKRLKPGRYSVLFTSRAGFVPGKQQIIELKDGERRTGVILLLH
ncbi:MAG TPA: hypothetical protein VJA94_22825 [Candidatus Angelobacter sp.]